MTYHYRDGLIGFSVELGFVRELETMSERCENFIQLTVNICRLKLPRHRALSVTCQAQLSVEPNINKPRGNPPTEQIRIYNL